MNKKKFTPKQVAALKQEATKVKHKGRDESKCFVCGEPLPEDRRRFCRYCVD